MAKKWGIRVYTIGVGPRQRFAQDIFGMRVPVGSGIDEQEDLARYFHDQYGLKVMHADPRELTTQGDEVIYGGDIVDLVYRDYSVADLLMLSRTGADVQPMRTLFRQNRVISSIAAELDQKSCWEVLTDPRIAERHFSSEERQIFRRHVLWTRIVAVLVRLRADHEDALGAGTQRGTERRVVPQPAVDVDARADPDGREQERDGGARSAMHRGDLRRDLVRAETLRELPSRRVDEQRVPAGREIRGRDDERLAAPARE